MAGYTKLFNSILASTIWRAEDRTRLVWITMLAMANKHGVVEASIPGLADFAHVSLDDCEKALADLAGPDPYSRTKANDGRRIQETDGGWILLNHGKYRALLSREERTEYNRIKQQETRARKAEAVNGHADSIDKSALSAQAEAEASPKAFKKEQANSMQPRSLSTPAMAQKAKEKASRKVYGRVR